MIVPATKTPDRFDELHKRLGEIPLHRIRTTPAPGTATEADLERVGKPICELIDGVLVDKPMGGLESLLATYVGGRIWNHTGPGGLGIVLGADGFTRVYPGQLRAPDVSYIPWSSFPGGELPDEAYWSIPPALIVEVLSPDNTPAEIDRKLRELFGAGVKLAWVIDPKPQSAKVYTSAARFKELTADGVLDGGRVLPGFKLPLADLFAATRKPKKKPR
jgi:Uma2 family endonuclease